MDGMVLIGIVACAFLVLGAATTAFGVDSRPLGKP